MVPPRRARPSSVVPFLEGPHVLLRPLTPGDVTPRYLRWINDQLVVQHLETGFFPSTLRSLRQYVSDHATRKDCLFLAIIDRRRGRHIGNVKLEPINWIHRTAILGIMVGDKRAWGKGLGTEAIRLVTHYAFRRLNLRKVSAEVRATNPGALRAFRKAGFVIEGRRRAEILVNGTPRDVFRLEKFPIVK